LFSFRFPQIQFLFVNTSFLPEGEDETEGEAKDEAGGGGETEGEVEAEGKTEGESKSATTISEAECSPALTHEPFGRRYLVEKHMPPCRNICHCRAVI